MQAAGRLVEGLAGLERPGGLVVDAFPGKTKEARVTLTMERLARVLGLDVPQAQVKKILDNVIFVLVPSLNPDGQIMVTDWFNKNVGTEYANSPIPYLYHPYVGHDNNRDMYMFTQKESQHTARLLWHDWFPTVWLDEHQMGTDGPRMDEAAPTALSITKTHTLAFTSNAPDAEGYRVFASVAGAPAKAIMTTKTSGNVTASTPSSPRAGPLPKKMRFSQ